ncbi:MAG: hypothetical protein ACK4X1_14495 [Terricaulis sp.]
MRISVFVVAAAMLLAVPAFAQVETPLPPETTSGGVSEPEAPPVTTAETAPAIEQAPAATGPVVEAELVCRNVSSRTESRLRSRRERVCKTQAEWDAQAAAESRSN